MILPVWTRRCFWRWANWVKLLGHSWHLNGLSPECVLKCTFKLLNCPNTLSHVSHLYSIFPSFFFKGYGRALCPWLPSSCKKNVKNRKKRKKTNFKQIYVSIITLILFCNICEIIFPVFVCCLHSGTKAVSGKWMVVLTAILELWTAILELWADILELFAVALERE